MVEFVEALADVGRGEVAVERAGDLVDVDADAVELAQDLGAEHVGAAAVFGQGKVRGEPAGDEREDDVGGEAGFALVAVLGGGLLEGGVLVGTELVLVGAALGPGRRRSGAPWRWAVSATPGAEIPEDRP